MASTIGAHFDGLYNLPDGQTLAEAVKAGTQSLKFSIEIGRAMAHGLSGGVFGELGGGDFGGGFAAGAFGSLAGSAMTTAKGQGFFGQAGDGDFTGLTKRTVAAAIVGGTAAELGGGKFANGAMTGAFVSLFSSAAQSATKPKGEWIYPEGGSTDINDYAVDGSITVRTNGILGNRAAAIDLANTTKSPVFFNPSGGFLADVWESFTQRIGFGSGDGLALGFAQGVSGARYPLNIIAHSQGTLTVTNAQFQYGLPAGSKFELRSLAITYARAAAAVRANGGTLNYIQPYGDGAAIWAPSLSPIKFGSGFLDIFNGFKTHTGNGL